MHFNNKGFTLVAGLLITLVVAMVGFTGYYVYNEQSKDSDAKARDTQESLQRAAEPVEQAVEQENYLEIEELGIKFELTDDLQDIYYNFDDGGEYAVVSVHYFDNIPGFEGCTAKAFTPQDEFAPNYNSGLVTVFKVEPEFEGPPVHGRSAEELRADKIPEIAGKFYMIAPNVIGGAPCWDQLIVEQTNPDVDKESKLRNILVDQQNTITSL